MACGCSPEQRAPETHARVATFHASASPVRTANGPSIEARDISLSTAVQEPPSKSLLHGAGSTRLVGTVLPLGTRPREGVSARDALPLPALGDKPRDHGGAASGNPMDLWDVVQRLRALSPSAGRRVELPVDLWSWVRGLADAFMRNVESGAISAQQLVLSEQASDRVNAYLSAMESGVSLVDLMRSIKAAYAGYSDAGIEKAAIATSMPHDPGCRFLGPTKICITGPTCTAAHATFDGTNVTIGYCEKNPVADWCHCKKSDPIRLETIILLLLGLLIVVGGPKIATDAAEWIYKWVMTLRGQPA